MAPNIKHKVWPLLILLVGIIGFGILKHLKKQPPHHPQPSQGPLVEVITAHETKQQVVLHTTGIVKNSERVEITPQVAGKVSWISPHFISGGHFAAGETLFQIEKADYEIALTQAKAQLLKAQQELEILKNRAQVAKKQWQKIYGNETPASSLVFLKPQLKAAQAALWAAQAAYRKAQLNLARTTVKAPFDCLIQEKRIALGSYVTPGKPVATVLGTKETEIWCPLSYQDLTWLKIPGKAKIKIEEKGHTFFYKGKILRIAPQTDKITKLNQIIVRVKDPYQFKKHIPGRPDLAEGMFVEVSLYGKRVDKIFVLPREVLRRHNTVWVAQKGRIKIKKVQIIWEEKDSVWVKGLQDGDQIIRTNLEAVAPGLKIRVTKGGEGK